jgi:hypothetical protein
MAGEQDRPNEFMTTELFADGTTDPPPDRWYPDATAGLVSGYLPVAEPELFDHTGRHAPVPSVEAPDTESVREAMQAVLAAEQGDDGPQLRRGAARSTGWARRESAQPGRLPVNRKEPTAAPRSRQGWPEQRNNPPRARARTRPARVQPALVIVLLLILVVVFFNVISALFEWLNSTFH